MSFLVNYGRVAFAPLVDYFIQTGTAPAVAGLAATAVWFGSAVPRLPTGWLLTYVRRHQVLIGVGLWLTGAAVATALAPDIWVIILGAFAIGLGTGAFFIAANPLVSELYPADVGIALGLRGFFSQLAAVSAPFLVAVALWAGSWRIGFIAMAVFALLITASLVRAVRKADTGDMGAADRDLLGGIRAEWRLIATGVACVGLAGFVWQGVFNFYITYLGAEKALSTGTASLLLTVMFAAGLPSFIVGGRLADRFSPLWVMLAIVAGFCVGLATLTAVDGLLGLVLVSIGLGTIIHGLFPVADAYMLASLPDHRRASAYAGYSATMMLMHAPGSVVVGVLAQTGFGYGAIFLGFSVLLAILTVGLWALALAGRLPGS